MIWIWVCAACVAELVGEAFAIILVRGSAEGRKMEKKWEGQFYAELEDK